MRYCLFVLLLLMIVATATPAAQPVSGGTALAVGPAAPADAESLPRTPPPKNLFGIVIRDPYYEWNLNTKQVRTDFFNAVLDDLATLGVEWVRIEFHDNPSPNGSFSDVLAQAQWFINAAHERGIKVVALLGTDILRGEENTLAYFNEQPGNLCDYSRYQLGCGLTEYLRAWLNRALDIATYYGDLVDAYELFNEQNRYFGLVEARRVESERLGYELPYQDEMNPILVARAIAKFARVVRHDYPRDKMNTPLRAPIVLGGLHPHDSTQEKCVGCTVENYLHLMYSSTNEFVSYHNRFGSWPIDGVAYHPYPQEIPERTLTDNEVLYRVPGAMLRLMQEIREHDSRSKLWITEIGTRGNVDSPADQLRQARFLQGFFQIAHYMREELDIFTIMWFKHEGWHVNEQWGLVHIPFQCTSGSAYPDPCRYDANRANWTRKESYHMYWFLKNRGFAELKVHMPLLTR